MSLFHLDVIVRVNCPLFKNASTTPAHEWKAILLPTKKRRRDWPQAAQMVSTKSVIAAVALWSTTMSESHFVGG